MTLKQHFSFFIPASVSVGVIALMLTGCSGGGSSTPAANTNGITEAYQTTKVQLATLSGVKSVSKSALQVSVQAVQQSSLVGALALTGTSPNFFGAGESWSTTAQMKDPRNNTPLITLKQWLGYQFDPTVLNNNSASVNVFGRMETAIGMFCATGMLLPSSTFGADRMPIAGTYNVLIDATAVTTLATCGINGSTLLGQTLAMVFSNTTDTTHYDRKLSINMGGSQPFVAYARNNASTINVALYEINTQGVYRTMVMYDRVSKIVRATYLSAAAVGANLAQTGLYGYRLHLNENTGEGRMFIMEGMAGDANTIYRYSVAGKPGDAAADLSLSMVSGYGDLSPGVHNACIKNDGTAFADGAVCISRTVPQATATGPAAVHANLYTNMQTNAWYSTTPETKVIEFTDTVDMYTVNFAP